MSRITGLFSCLASLLIMTACSPAYYWGKAGATQQDWEADKTECRVMAARYVPVDQQSIQMTSGYRNPTSSNCYNAGGGVIQCSTTGGEYVPPTRYSYDANESLRSDAVETCLYRKGWQKITSQEYEARKRNLGSNSYVPPSTQNNLKTTGDPCSASYECAGKLQCIGGRCAALLEQGESCNRSVDCRGDLQCIGGRCGSNKLLEGSSCNTNNECQSGLQCQLGRCRTISSKLLGQICSSTTECEGNLLCLRGRCESRGKQGAACKVSYECEGDLQCIAGKCKTQ